MRINKVNKSIISVFLIIILISFAACTKVVQRENVGIFSYLPPSSERWIRAGENEMKQLPDSSVSGVDIKNYALYLNEELGATVLVQSYSFTGVGEERVSLREYFEDYKQKASLLGDVNVVEFDSDKSIQIMQSTVVFSGSDICNVKTVYLDSISSRGIALDVMLPLSSRELLIDDLTKLLDSIESFI